METCAGGACRTRLTPQSRRQLLTGAPAKVKTAFLLGEAGPSAFPLTSGCVKVDGVDDAADFNETLEAMKVPLAAPPSTSPRCSDAPSASPCRQ